MAWHPNLNRKRPEKVIKQPNGIYRVDFYLHGKRVRRSSGTRNYEEALLFERRLREELEATRGERGFYRKATGSLLLLEDLERTEDSDRASQPLPESLAPHSDE